MDKSVSPMPKQVSALNTFWLFQYISEYHPEVDVAKLINIINKKSYYVENIKTGSVVVIMKDPTGVNH
jgi:hypothetical protein